MRNIFRSLLITLFAVFGGGHAGATAPMGEAVVICGADGAKRVVIFDFDTGAPVEADASLGFCNDCVACAAALPSVSPSPVMVRLSAPDAVIISIAEMGQRAIPATARAPPFS